VTTTTEKRAGKKLPKPEVTQQEVFTRWAELDYQKNFDNDKSSRADEDHKIPAGKFMCLLYTVSISDDRASKSAKAWYIKEKPGVLAEYEEVLVVASAGTKEKDTQTTHFVLEDLKTK
jgi:hypothetical protein